MYPLRFTPLFQRYLWGGRRLAEVLHKPIGDQNAAESWEIVDHEEAQSVVAYGPLAGKTLRELIDQRGRELLGDRLFEKISAPALPQHLRGRFPLLLKFLDANQNLSVQVHPDDALGATLTPPDLGKTEAWYVMQADPGSKIYAGLKMGVTQADFAAAIQDGKTETLLHQFEPQVGDCVFIPAGTLHAIGAGLLIAEIQQASNTTFRVHDWGRVDAEGNSRPLHVEQAMVATDFSTGPIDPIRVDASARAMANNDEQPSAQLLVSCDKFEMRRVQIESPTKFGGDGRMRILVVTDGRVIASKDPSASELVAGQAMVLPAAMPSVRFDLAGDSKRAALLEIFVPE